MKLARFSSRANSDLMDIARYIALESSRRMAIQFTEALRAKCHTLANHQATLGRARDELMPGLRSLAYQRYVILFRYLPDNVEIVTIIHGMRDLDAIFSED